jgi:hypothetical protein
MRPGETTPVGHAIIVRHAPTTDFSPHIVAAPRDDDREVLVGKFGEGRQLVQHGAEFLERLLERGRQQLVHDVVHGLEGQAAGGELHLHGRRPHVRFVAGVQHQRFAVGADNGLEQ